MRPFDGAFCKGGRRGGRGDGLLAWAEPGWAISPARTRGRPRWCFREPDDPVEGVLLRAAGRISPTSPKDYTREASERGLHELDEAIKTGPTTPGCTGSATYPGG